jgi:RNA polymerase sigma-70 factor (ECF subfamily)
MPQATSFALAAQLLGKMTTPSQAAMRAESKLQIQEALNAMDPIDREVLTLRHFEMLTNAETAKVLELSQAAASNRYVRALKRMKEILEETRGENS